MLTTDLYDPCKIGSKVQVAYLETVAGFNHDGCLQKEPIMRFLCRHISPTGGNRLQCTANGLYVAPDLFITNFQVQGETVTITRSDGETFTQQLLPTACEQLKVRPKLTDPRNNLDEEAGGYLAFGHDGNCYRHTPQLSFFFRGSLEDGILNPAGSFVPLPNGQGQVYTFTLAHDKVMCFDIRIALENVITNAAALNPANKHQLILSYLLDGVQSSANNTAAMNDYESVKDVYILGCQPVAAGTHTIQLNYTMNNAGSPGTQLHVVRTGIVPTWFD